MTLFDLWLVIKPGIRLNSGHKHPEIAKIAYTWNIDKRNDKER